MHDKEKQASALEYEADTFATRDKPMTGAEVAAILRHRARQLRHDAQRAHRTAGIRSRMW